MTDPLQPDDEEAATLKAAEEARKEESCKVAKERSKVSQGIHDVFCFALFSLEQNLVGSCVMRHDPRCAEASWSLALMTFAADSSPPLPARALLTAHHMAKIVNLDFFPSFESPFIFPCRMGSVRYLSPSPAVTLSRPQQREQVPRKMPQTLPAIALMQMRYALVAVVNP